MLKQGFLKPEISIQKIGKTHFWIGIIMGTLISIILSLGINYLREALRFSFSLGDLFILPESDFKVYDFFFALFSTCIGFGFTLYFWLSNRKLKLKKNYLRTLAISNIWLTIFVFLLAITRFGTVIFLILYGLKGYDEHFDFLNDFWIILTLIPFLIFYSNWNVIRIFFKTKRWPLISASTCLLFSFILFQTTSIDHQKLNKSNYYRYADRFDYIEKEFKNAEQYGIFFDPDTKKIMGKFHAERTSQLIQKTKNAFLRNEPISLDTLILEKIFIHNKNTLPSYYGRRSPRSDKYWPYAYPTNVFSQIEKHETNSIEAKVLFDILHEQSKIVYAPKFSTISHIDYKQEERLLIWQSHILLRNTKNIVSDFNIVMHKIKRDEKYKKYHHLFPEILPPLPPYFEFDELQ